MRNSSGQTPLHTASVYGATENVEALLERGVDKNELTDHGRSPLSLAAENDQPYVTEVLLDAGSDINCVAFDGSSAVALATTYAHSEVMKVLIQHGAELSARNADGKTPLHEAASWNDAGAIDTAIKVGACTEVQDGNGRTPLLFAFGTAMAKCADDGNYSSYSERFSAVIAVLKHGANVNQPDPHQNLTLLHFCANSGCPRSVLHALLAAGPGLNLRDDEGCTPLHWAKGEVLEAMLQNGADMEAQDSNG